MGNGEQSGLGGRSDWPVRLSGAVGCGVCAALALLVMSLADLHMFPLGLIVFLAAVGVGTFLGRLAGSRLFGRSPGE
jgi:hypothetical protein